MWLLLFLLDIILLISYLVGVIIMNTAKQIITDLIEDMQEYELAEVIDFITFIKLKKEKQLYKDMIKASESSIDFWYNDIDDEVWNDV